MNKNAMEQMARSNTSGFGRDQDHDAADDALQGQKVDKKKGKSSMFKSQTRDELKNLEGYYRPAYEKEFQNDPCRYNPKRVQEKMKGKVLFDYPKNQGKQQHPNSYVRKSLERLAEIALNLRESSTQAKSNTVNHGSRIMQARSMMRSNIQLNNDHDENGVDMFSVLRNSNELARSNLSPSGLNEHSESQPFQLTSQYLDINAEIPDYRATPSGEQSQMQGSGSNKNLTAAILDTKISLQKNRIVNAT